MPQQPGYWTQTHWQIGHMLPMYELSAHGLETGMKRLMAKNNSRFTFAFLLPRAS